MKIEKEQHSLLNLKQSLNTENKINIAKVILIYDDGSFSSFNPSSGNI